ncbi:GGDEF domain-containing phosphodiesterase [Asaia krungthepensis]|uniref:Sensory box/GGDEF family protein n=1 Tax=Asaia krungthepensis NRIC 0535 TaxID=1307925 RepID=A0ABQ0Q1K0_9PROT|nr:GGDEF domain-containing phosphodiesterase [Asaia krungthepensis]GBQ86935.1 sensory box/GGDEF family protein [Asaia krungthepensis NRIC 0535]
MSPITQLQPHTAILEIARRLLSASSICIRGFDSAGELIEIASDGSSDCEVTAACVRAVCDAGDLYLEKTETGHNFGISLDNDLTLLAKAPFSVSESELRELAPYLAVCARTILVNQTLQTRRPDLPDRGLCAAHITSLIETTSCETRKASFSVLEIDLDQLNTLNLRHGWATSNRVIDEAISRVRTILPGQAFLGYAGGGNIIVVSPPGLSLVTSRTLIASIRQALSPPIQIDNGEIQPAFSIGWALFPDDGANAASLLQAVDAAIAEIRRHGGAHERRASPISTAALIGTSGLERDLALAVERSELSLNWMPIISPGTQTVVALEALLRWERPGSGQVPPDVFIQCAENGGLIERLDQWALRAACETAVGWSHPLRVCVNISPTWLAKRLISGMVETILEETGLEPSRLQIELSEKRSFGPRDIAYQELSRLRALGVHVALDDFGAGYSSLERLANFPVDQIKFDRSFMQRLNDDRRVNEVMGQTIQMARRLGISCCAKGVETERQMAFLDSYGCEEVQGYLLGIPTPDYL